MTVVPTADVLAANAAFYDAFDRRDVAAMDALWARRVPVACVHPGWAPLIGREAVMESWRTILLGPSPPRIACASPVVHPAGEGGAIVVCIEVIRQQALAATNVFVLEDGCWRLVQHHAGPMAATPSADDDPDRTVH